MPRPRGPERACRNCGKQFTSTGRTVNCPDCRGPKKQAEKTQPREYTPSTVCTWCDGERIVSSQRADGTVHTGPCGMCGGTGRNLYAPGAG